MIDIQRIRLKSPLIDTLGLSDAAHAILQETSLSIVGMVTHNPLKRMSQFLQGHVKCTLSSDQPASSFTELFGKEALLETDFKIRPDRYIELQPLKFNALNVSMSGSFLLNSAFHLHLAAFTGEASHLSHFNTLFDFPIDGEISFNGHAETPLDTPYLLMNIKSPSLSFSKKTFTDLQSSIRLQNQLKKVNGDIKLAAAYQSIPFKASTAFEWDGQDTLALHEIEIHALKTELTGTLSWNSQTLWSGALEGKAKALQEFSPYLNVPLQGVMDFKAFLKPAVLAANRSSQGFELECRIGDLQSGSLQIEQLKLNIEGVPSSTQKSPFSLAAKLEGKNLQLEQLQAERLHAAGSHELNLREPIQRMVENLKIEWELNKISSKKKEWAAENCKGLTTLIDINDLKSNIGFLFQDISFTNGFLNRLEGTSLIDVSHKPWSYQLKGVGRWKEPFQFAMDGTWLTEGGKWNISIGNLQGFFSSYPFALKMSAHFSENQEMLELEEYI